MLGTLKLFDTGLEAGDGFAQELGSRFALAIVVFAEVLLLGTNALLTGRFRSVTTLGWNMSANAGGKWKRRGQFTIFLFLDIEKER